MKQSDLDLLQTIPIYHLHTIARIRHVILTTATPEINANTTAEESAELEEIAQQLFQPEALNELLCGLSEDEQLLLQELVSCGGRANSRDLALYFSSAGLIPNRHKQEMENDNDSTENSEAGGLRYPNAHPHGPFEQALRALLMQGLLFWTKQASLSGRDYASGTHDGIVVVPPSVRATGEKLWQTDESNGEAHAAEISARMRHLQRRLYRYWSAVVEARDGLTILNNGLLSRSAWRLVVARVAEGVPEHTRAESEAPSLLFLRLLAQKLGILRVRDNVLLPGSAEAYFALPLWERIKRCYHLASEGSFWNEMAYLPEINVRPGPELLEEARAEVVRARMAVIACLAREAPGEWHSLASFIARTRLYEPHLLFPRQPSGSHADRYSSECNPYGWDFRLQRGWLTHREGWYLVEGGFIRTVITGLLTWLGIVELDIHSDQEEPATAFRLLPDGLDLLKGYTLPEEESHGRLIVQPNFELVALAPISEALLIDLDRFAERVKLEYIAQYRLSRGSITQALQRGFAIEEILRTLEQAAGGDLPQNVRYTVLEWERQARRVEIWHDATLLEVDDAALLDTLLASQQADGLFRQRLTPTLIEVAPGRLREAQNLLWEHDYLPALTEVPANNQESPEEQADQEPQWSLREDGLLQPLYNVLNFYLVKQAERFCEYDEDTGWLRLSAASIHNAQKGGLTLEEIMGFLHCYCLGGIPGSLLPRLKLWGNGYEGGNSIHIERAPLLALSEQILQDLKRDEEIYALLEQVVAPEQRLVHVAEDQLERLLQLLRERGFTVE